MPVIARSAPPDHPLLLEGIDSGNDGARTGDTTAQSEENRDVLKNGIASTVLLLIAAGGHAICPIGEELESDARHKLHADEDRNQGPVTYQLAGVMDDGTIVLHALDGGTGTPELHEVLVIRPAADQSDKDINVHPVRIGSDLYSVERLPSVAIDPPCSGWISVESDGVVMTIASP